MSGRRHRGEEPRRAVEEIRGGAGGAAGRATGERMPRYEALVLDRLRERALRRADVRDGRIRADGGQHVVRCRDERADGHGDDDELGAGHGVGQRPRRAVEGLRAEGFAEGFRIGVPAGHPGHPGPLGGEGDRGPEEARSDDRERPDGGLDRLPRGLGGPPVTPQLLLHHIEHRGENSLHCAL